MFSLRTVFIGWLLIAVVLFSGCRERDVERVAFMRSVHSALIIYAHDHEGFFPRSENGPLASLQLLYPEYCPSGRELAGLSGNINATVSALQAGQPLTEQLSSWIYVPGLKTNDDPRIAVLWDAKAGLYANGTPNSSGARAVILLQGDITNIPPANWTNFVNEQKELRENSWKKRQSGNG